MWSKALLKKEPDEAGESAVRVCRRSGSLPEELHVTR
jgi:hypothetical protein